MANYIRQVRYYKDGYEFNEPKTLTAEILKTQSDKIFGTNITQFGVQTIPGAKIRINDSSDFITVGPTGIFELDLKKQMIISKLAVKEDTIDAIANNEGAYIIFDIVYDTKPEEFELETNSLEPVEEEASDE